MLGAKECLERKGHTARPVCKWTLWRAAGGERGLRCSIGSGRLGRNRRTGIDNSRSIDEHLRDPTRRMNQQAYAQARAGDSPAGVAIGRGARYQDTLLGCLPGWSRARRSRSGCRIETAHLIWHIIAERPLPWRASLQSVELYPDSTAVES